MNYWLLKTEPAEYSIDDLCNAPGKITSWQGVRNYQARNMLRDQIHIGDHAFFYHSSCNTPGITGIVEVLRKNVDDSAFDPSSPYYDPRSTAEKPLWFSVDVRLVKKLPQIISLQQLRQQPQLQDMILLRKGNRLSVSPVTALQWKVIKQLY